MALQYVILAHTVNGETHYDLMLEQPGQDRLRTLQLPRWPLRPGECCPYTELRPHRRAYLDYEGEISGGRGTVTRVERGVWARTGTGRLQLTPEGATGGEFAVSASQIEAIDGRQETSNFA